MERTHADAMCDGAKRSAPSLAAAAPADDETTTRSGLKRYFSGQKIVYEIRKQKRLHYRSKTADNPRGI